MQDDAKNLLPFTQPVRTEPGSRPRAEAVRAESPLALFHAVLPVGAFAGGHCRHVRLFDTESGRGNYASLRSMMWIIAIFTTVSLVSVQHS